VCDLSRKPKYKLSLFSSKCTVRYDTSESKLSIPTLVRKSLIRSRYVHTHMIIRFYIWTQLSTISWWSILLMEQTGIHRRKPLTCLKKHIPYLGFYNAQDFAQIFYFVGGVRIINRNNVLHSFTDREITCLPCFFVYYCQHAKLDISSYENTNKTQHI
jgi:hypothetical protein